MSEFAAPMTTKFAGGPVPPGSPPLDWHAWPLYSCIALDALAIPRQIECFNYLPGSLVSGAGAAQVAATALHTNATAVRTIAAPKVQVVTSIRIVLPPLAFTSTTALADDSVGVALENNDQADDVTLLMSMYFQFRIGEKVYAEAPLWMAPANAGVGGVAATSVSNTNAASVWQTRVALHTCGLAYEFSTGKNPVLWNQQSFRFFFGCDWATNPTLNDTHLLYAVLEGFEGREIQ